MMAVPSNPRARNKIQEIDGKFYKVSAKNGTKYLIENDIVYLGDSSDCKVMDRLDSVSYTHLTLPPTPYV